MRREVVQQALEALEQINELSVGENAISLPGEIDGAMDALRAALDAPEPDYERGFIDGMQEQMKRSVDRAVRAMAGEREWVELTDEEIYEAQDAAGQSFRRHRMNIRGQQITPADSPDWHLARAIEAKLKEKNT